VVYRRSATSLLKGGEDKIATQVCPDDLVDGEDHDLKVQLKEQVRDRLPRVESP
jgi:hypothetical protein